jgi:tetratricopeptide (TPR) repeat protein
MRSRYSLVSWAVVAAVTVVSVGHAAAGGDSRPGWFHEQAVSADDLYNSAVDLQTVGRYEQAAQLYGQALSRRPVFPDAWLNRGICYLGLSQYDRAVADFDKFIGRKPDVALGYVNRGVAYTALGKFDEAMSDFDRAANLPGPRGQRSLIFLNRGNAYAKKGDFERARAEYSTGLALPADEYFATIRPLLFIARAEAALQLSPPASDDAKRDLSGAEIGIREAVAHEPKNPRNAYLYVTLARAREKAGDKAGAVADYERFLRLQPDYPERAEIEKRLAELKAGS